MNLRNRKYCTVNILKNNAPFAKKTVVNETIMLEAVEMTEKPKIGKFLCPRCPKEYQSRNDLVRHLKKIHGVTVQPIVPEGDSFYSEYCREFSGAGADR